MQQIKIYFETELVQPRPIQEIPPSKATRWKKLVAILVELNIYTVIYAVIRMIKSKRMKGSGHVARMERRGMHIQYWRESHHETTIKAKTYMSG
jgi:hypothetical protein